jgi:ABC-type multidrug transport system ATPase subunit
MMNDVVQYSRNTYIGDEGTRGVSGKRWCVSIGVDIIHGSTLLFRDKPTSGLDSTSAHSVIEKVHDITCVRSTVVLTIHKPVSCILLLLLDHFYHPKKIVCSPTVNLTDFRIRPTL